MRNLKKINLDSYLTRTNLKLIKDLSARNEIIKVAGKNMKKIYSLK